MFPRTAAWMFVFSFLCACATPERRFLATIASLAHHEHLERFEAECRLKQKGPDTFNFECQGAAPVSVQCSVAGNAECCWVLEGAEAAPEDRKCRERRVATRAHHGPH